MNGTDILLRQAESLLRDAARAEFRRTRAKEILVRWADEDISQAAALSRQERARGIVVGRRGSTRIP